MCRSCGISEQEFWHLQPAQINSLVDFYEYQHYRQDYRAALICAVLANIHRNPKRRAFVPADFMPGKRLKGKQTPGQIKTMIKGINKALLGKVKKVKR